MPPHDHRPSREAGASGGVSGAPADPNVGRVIAGRYRLIRMIAKGGMGRVYLAAQMPLERKVAVKLLITHQAEHEDEEFVKRFILEASVCARLSHPNIVTVHDYGEGDNPGDLFIAMEFLDGVPLSKELTKVGALPPERAIQIALQVSRGLRHAHELGVVHRDLKPGNIILLSGRDEDSSDYVKILDFGLVKVFHKEQSPLDDTTSKRISVEPGDPNLTRTNTIMGSPRYMAPEQIVGDQVDPRTDVYALGVILYQMIAGRTPFDASKEIFIVHKHLHETPPPIEGCHPELSAIVMRCLEKKPEQRYESMAALAKDLKSALRSITGNSVSTDSSIAAQPLPPKAPAEGAGKTPPWETPTVSALSSLGPATERAQADITLPALRRDRKVVLLGGVVAVLLGAIVTVAVLRPGSAPPAPEAPPLVQPTMLLESVPPGASVTEGGRRLGSTPLTVPLDPTHAGIRRFELSREGHLPEVVEQEASRTDVRVKVSLRPAAPVAPPASAPAVAAPARAPVAAPPAPVVAPPAPGRGARTPKRDAPAKPAREETSAGDDIRITR